MKLLDVLILSAAVAFVIIAIHQTFVYGFSEAYWAVMVSMVLLFVYVYRKRR